MTPPIRPQFAPEFFLRPTVFNPEWLKYPADRTPRRAALGAGAWLQRETLVRAYHPKQLTQLMSTEDHTGQWDWKSLSHHERWAAAMTRWLRLFETVDFHSPDTVRNQQRIPRCPSSGYSLPRARDGSRPTPCLCFVCPSCFARKVKEAFLTLCRASRRRPKGTTVYTVGVTGRTAPEELNAKVRAVVPAGAVLFRYPAVTSVRAQIKSFAATRTEDLRIGWYYSGILLVDNPERYEGWESVYPVRGVFDLARACLRWFPYPKRWTSGPPTAALHYALRATATVPKKFLSVTLYGVCRADYVDGKQWLGWSTPGVTLPPLPPAPPRRRRVKKFSSPYVKTKTGTVNLRPPQFPRTEL